MNIELVFLAKLYNKCSTKNPENIRTCISDVQVQRNLQYRHQNSSGKSFFTIVPQTKEAYNQRTHNHNKAYKCKKSVSTFNNLLKTSLITEMWTDLNMIWDTDNFTELKMF